MNLPDAALASAQGALRLVDWGVIRAQGADASAFLHGQLTQDVQTLDQAGVRLAGYCSPKGRLLASGLLWRAGAEDWLWACSKDVLPAALKRLSMYVLRARCKLSDASAELPLHGLVGEAATQWLGADAPPAPWRSQSGERGQVLRLPDGHVDSDSAGRSAVARYVLVAAASHAPPELPALEGGAWEWLEAGSGIARIVSATVEQFVPQMVNYEVVGGVNFQKGCFPGQEIVARSQYRGSVKRRGFVFDCDAPASPGVEVFHDGDPTQPAGQVVNAGSWLGAHRALVEVKLAALDSGSLHMGSADGPLLRVVEQPYALPADNAA
ncbi:MAG: folate-binding protein [Burkholderiaceae bacterium]